jgi:hypothetical protein
MGLLPMAAATAVHFGEADGSTSDPDRVVRIHDERREERDRRWLLSGYLLERAEVRLLRIPDKIVTASLPLRRSYAGEAGITYVAIPDFAFGVPGLKLRGNSLELEGDFLQHFGREHASEVAGSLVLRSGSFGLLGRTSMDLAIGNGLSFYFNDPTDEDGVTGLRGVDTKKLQYHISFEAEVTSGAVPRLHYLFRVHHRSGAYGLISQNPTGSNYLGFGLRWDLKR